MEAETVSQLSRPLSQLTHRSLDRSLSLSLSTFLSQRPNQSKYIFFVSGDAILS